MTRPDTAVSFSVYIMLRYFGCGLTLGKSSPETIYGRTDCHEQERLVLLFIKLVTIT